MDMDEENSDFERYDSDESELEDVDLEDSVPDPQSFETLTTDEIMKLMSQNIEHVNAIVQMPATTTRILLSQTKWEKQHLLDKITGEVSDEYFKKANVINPFADPIEQNTFENIDCNICFIKISKEDIIRTGCGHTSCKDCWQQYLTYKILDDGKVDAISCPETKCSIVVDDDIVMQLVTDEKAIQKYQHLITNSFVEHNHLLRWCPSPGCTFAIKTNLLITNQQNCSCKCGHSFCFNCGESTHDPIPCKLMENWKINANDETVEYLTKHTKECPKCDAIIEKNGGCNRMICTKCQHPFCWLCYGPMETYAHQCNKYEENEKGQRNLVRWQHYFKRYSLHKKSLECESKLKAQRISEIMKDLQLAGKAWNEVQFLFKAVDILCESRRQLMFTYIFAYYIEDHHQKTIFETNQNDLESATETLSQYLEENITKDNVEDLTHMVLDKSSYCEKRQKSMQDHIYDGFENDWWKFTIDSWSRLRKLK